MPEQTSGFTATTSTDNAEATATKAAEAGKRHRISHVSGSFSAAAIKLLQIKNGATVIWEGYVHNSLIVNFDPPLLLSDNTAANAVLAASGTGSVLGKVNIAGYTRGT